MARREQLYQGELLAPDGRRVYGEVWTNGAIAIVFDAPWRRQLEIISDPVVGLTDDRRLSVSGVAEDGASVKWEAIPEEQVRLLWQKVKVTLPDGVVIEQATVRVSQYRVEILKAGQETREFVGAVAAQHGSRRIITTFEGDEIVVESKRGCGCGGI